MLAKLVWNNDTSPPHETVTFYSNLFFLPPERTNVVRNMVRPTTSGILQHLAEQQVGTSCCHELSSMDWQCLNLADVEDGSIIVVTNG